MPPSRRFGAHGQQDGTRHGHDSRIAIPSASRSAPLSALAQGSSHQLFWSIGDSGPGLDPDNHAQNVNDLHGTIVRISVPASGSGYTIPGGNLDVGEYGEIAACLIGEGTAICVPLHVPKVHTYPRVIATVPRVCSDQTRLSTTHCAKRSSP